MQANQPQQQHKIQREMMKWTQSAQVLSIRQAWRCAAESLPVDMKLAEDGTRDVPSGMKGSDTHSQTHVYEQGHACLFSTRLNNVQIFDDISNTHNLFLYLSRTHKHTQTQTQKHWETCVSAVLQQTVSVCWETLKSSPGVFCARLSVIQVPSSSQPDLYYQLNSTSVYCQHCSNPNPLLVVFLLDSWVILLFTGMCWDPQIK